MKRRLIFLIAFSVALASLQTLAEPVVLLDEGGESTEVYRQILQPPRDVPDFGGLWIQTYSPLIQENPEDLNIWLPLISQKLSPRRLAENNEKVLQWTESLDSHHYCSMVSQRFDH